jgi:hypothetical protein
MHSKFEYIILLEDNDESSKVLKWINMPVMSNADCEAGFKGPIPSSNICLDTKMINGACNVNYTSIQIIMCSYIFYLHLQRGIVAARW